MEPFRCRSDSLLLISFPLGFLAGVRLTPCIDFIIINH